MIYYKKKSLIKKAINKIKEKTQNLELPVFSLSKGFFVFLGLFIVGLYLTYLFLMPKFIDEAKIENAINNFVLKNSKLTLDISNLQIKPNYKFDINLKADYIKLKYPNKKDFLWVSNPDIDINILSLFYKYIDLNKIKTDKIEINTSFTDENKYDCFKYFDIMPKKTATKFKIKNINLSSDIFLLNLYDENIKKNFYIKSNKLKISSSEFKKTITISTNGKIASANHKISDFNLNLSIKLNPDSIGKFREKLAKLNKNPLYWADKYDFYTKSDINLKINNQNKNPDILGTVLLSDYTFKIQGLTLPKNKLLLNFKGGKITTDCDFKFIKNQFIQIKSNATISKNNFIEAKLISNEINLSDLREILDAIGKIFNFKFNLNDIDIQGTSKIDVYLKSNFKTLQSKGNLLIKDTKIKDKKTGLILNNINSNINFANNTINIINTSAFINKAKFNLIGTIDDKTNLNIKINSDEINIAQLLSLIKELPFSNMIMPKLKDYEFKNGLLKINSNIIGTLKHPILKSNSNLSNFKVYLKKYNKEIYIPKLHLNFLEKDIEIPNTKIIVDNITFNINGTVKNYKTKQTETIINIQSDFSKGNKLLLIKNKPTKLNSQINIKQNKLTISSCNISNMIFVSGEILNLDKNPYLNNVKINILDKTPLVIPNYENLNFSAKGNILISGNIEKPNITGNLNLQNITLNDLNLNISDLILNIKNSEFYINIIKGRIFDFDFDLVAQAKLIKNKVVVDFAQIQSMYVNLESFEKYLKNSNTINKLDYEINNIKGNILTIETSDILLNNVSFEGNVKNNILNIETFSAETLNGKITGKTSINLLNQKTKAELILKELNIRLLSNKLKNLSIATSGKLSALINAEFKGFDIDEILNTLDGYIKFNIDNGELSQFAKLERFLQAGNILSQSILKLTLNSTLSAITKQNTGDFKTIEGTVKIKNSIANIQYINSQGSNMSLYITGTFNLLNQYASTKILGRIPNSIVSVMGNIGKFSLSQKVDEMDKDTKETINLITASPIEKKLSTTISQNDYNKIPPLAYQVDEIPTREFIVLIEGIIKNNSSIQDFKWIIKE